MAETDNPKVLPSPRSAGFGEGSEGRGVRQERGLSGSRVGPIARLGHLIRDVRGEMRRVSWPSAREVKNTTVITLIAVVFFATYLFAVDQGLARLILGVNWVLAKVLRFLGLA